MRYPDLLAAIETARQTGAVQNVELHQTVPAETWHRVEIAPLGTLGLLVVTLQSLTEAKRIVHECEYFPATAMAQEFCIESQQRGMLAEMNQEYWDAAGGS